MKKSVIKKWIIGLIIGIAIIVSLLVIIIGKGNKENQPKELIAKDENLEETQKIVTDEERIEQYDFLVVSNCINSYLSGINQNSSSYYGRDENDNYTIVVEQEQINKNAYHLLSDEYIEKNAITLENVYDYVPEVRQNLIFIPLDMKLQQGENINQYKVYGYVTDLEYNFINYLYTIVNLDVNNKTFSIEPINKKTYDNDSIENSNIVEVKRNENNQYKYQQLSEEYRLKQYFQNYKVMLLSNIDIAYEFLDKNYKEKCFGNIENFKKYVNENKDKIVSATLEGYDSTVKEDVTEYMERDLKGNYYIFNISNQNSAEFKVMLDNYVIGFSGLQEDYEKSSIQEKVSMNTMRFIQAINDKKYYYVYNLLAESFRERNFKTQEDFEEYIKDKFFESNIIQEGDFQEEGNYYTYDLIIADDEGNTKKLGIVMQLQEENDFVMSFNIE